MSVTAQIWNAVRTLNRRIELGSGNAEALDEAIMETVKEMAEVIDLPNDWKG